MLAKGAAGGNGYSISHEICTWICCALFCWITGSVMMTSSNGNIFRVTGHLCGEFTGHRWIPRTKASDAELWCFFYLRLNKRLSKQSWGWWFETPSRPLWRHSNVLHGFVWAIYTCSSELLHRHSSNRMISPWPMEQARRLQVKETDT